MVPCEERYVVCSLERTYQAAVVENSDAKGATLPPKAIPKKKKQPLRKRPQEVGNSGGAASVSAPVHGAPPSIT